MAERAKLEESSTHEIASAVWDYATGRVLMSPGQVEVLLRQAAERLWLLDRPPTSDLDG